jgi:hypothetical protein
VAVNRGARVSSPPPEQLEPCARCDSRSEATCGAGVKGDAVWSGGNKVAEKRVRCLIIRE